MITQGIQENDFRQYFDKHSRPLCSLTDEIWQKDFEYMKNNIKSYNDGENKKMKYIKAKTTYDEYGNYMSDTRTNYQLYCQFINDILSEIRKGNIAFLFFEYHIKQLLCFHHDTLRTKYMGGYWEVWIEKEVI